MTTFAWGWVEGTARSNSTRGGRLVIAEESVLDEAAVRELERARNLLEFLAVQGSCPNRVAAKQKVHGAWRDVSWGEVVSRTRRLAEGLVASGIKPGDRVCIFSATRLEWCLADFAILAAGAISVPIYASDTLQEIEHIVKNSGARAVIFDHDQPEKADGRWTRLKQIRERLPQLERFFSMDMTSLPQEQMWSFADLEAAGAERLRERPGELERRARELSSADLACILYTSGTTGPPKGVMLTHGNWTYQAKAVGATDLLARRDVVLLFLPLAHSFAKVVEVAWLGQSFIMSFAESVEKVVDDAAEVRPTVIPAVPRIFEKAFTQVRMEGLAQPGLKGRMFSWAMQLFEEYAAARAMGRFYSSVQWALAKRMVFSQVGRRLRERFGGRVRLFISGGAPLSRKIGYFFEMCGLTLLEGYGLTETSAPTHANRPFFNRIGTVGRPFPGVEVRVADDGEILLRGPQVMKGYYNLPEDTAEVLEPDGWFHTGDIGEVDDEGCLHITDRKKDLIKTSGGKYIAPQELENALRREPLVSQAMIVGDKRRFVSALVTISEENARRWARERQLASPDYSELIRHPEVRARVQEAVDAVNATLPSYATIKKFAILDQEWSQSTGELTPKLSVRRKFVAEKYRDIVDSLYGERIE
jgi:long-chain acyl-CoA synthetase